MLKHRIKCLVLGAALALSTAAVGASPEIGKPAPAFKAVDALGKPVELSAYKGKTVVLEWTNHECPFVKKHYESGNMPKLQQQTLAQDVVWLQVLSSAPGKQGHVDGTKALKLNAARKAVPTRVVLDSDGAIGKLYGAQTTPHLFIVDSSGTLVYRGAIDSIASADQADIAKAENYVTSALAALAAGKPIAKSSTKPYGCGIKYAG